MKVGMMLKPAQNRQKRKYEDTNRIGRTPRQHLWAGTPFISSYLHILEKKNVFTVCCRILAASYDFISFIVASAGPMAGRTDELWARRTYHPPLNVGNSNVLAKFVRTGQHTVQHNIERASQ
jgi:hypothetical protein